MEQAPGEYQISSFCNYGDCVGVSRVFEDQETGREMVDIVNTKSPDEVVATVPRDFFAANIVAMQENVTTVAHLITGAAFHEDDSFLSRFDDEEKAAFRKAVMVGEFDEVAGVDDYIDRMPEDMTLEEYLGIKNAAWWGNKPRALWVPGVSIPSAIGYLGVRIDRETGKIAA